MVKERVDFVTGAEDGRGVVELIDEIVGEDLKRREDRLTRDHIVLGKGESRAQEKLLFRGIRR
jgi:hypothetical protein